MKEIMESADENSKRGRTVFSNSWDVEEKNEEKTKVLE
jgi:hypothetical protein